MFSSKKDKDTPPPPQANVPPAKRAARSSAPSIISADLVVNGTLTSTGDIQIDGRVEGDVHSAGLVIGDKAYIHGEVLAEEVTIRGRVHGSIRARKVLLCSTSHVEGNILHEAFAVETGAFFEGNCRHADNPLAEDAGKKTTEFKAAPAATSSSAPSAVSAMVSRPMASDPSRASIGAGLAAPAKS
ncbi:MAG: polymer-forming cytoskeletal protein [Proteobacteria bacterium]|nr:polymer-forming cytoskeletal protein [Pseudomonadota bacterium]